MSLGLAFFVIPFIKLDIQNLSQTVGESKRNKGTNLDKITTLDLKPTTVEAMTANLKKLGIVKNENAYTVEKDKYDRIEKNPTLTEVTVNGNTITAPKNKTLSFSTSLDATTGIRVLRVENVDNIQIIKDIDTPVRIEKLTE